MSEIAFCNPELNLLSKLLITGILFFAVVGVGAMFTCLTNYFLGWRY